jgi:membrane associated rhomboid family serine protease
MAPPRAGAGSSFIGARPTPGATLLLILEVGLFLLLFAALGNPSWVQGHLALVPVRAFGREPWQLITSGLIHLGGKQLVSSAIGIWLIGSAVEQRSSRGRMLLVFAASQLAGAIITAAVGRLVAPTGVFDGCGPGVFGLIAAFGVLLGPIPLHFLGLVEVRGRTLALIYIGLSFAVGLYHGEYVSLAGDAAGIAMGWALAAGAASRLVLAWDRFRLWRLRRRYKVISGGRDTRRYLN